MNQRTDTQWTPYLATAVAEGWEDGSKDQCIEAFAYLTEHELYLQLQGWFGRQIASLVESGYLTWEGKINWWLVDQD